MPYQRLIIVATGCQLHEAAEVEEFMRSECPTLSHLDPFEFAALARDAYEAMQVLDDLQSSALH
jgi:hypothetical protein